MSSVAVVGAGYVGLSTAACLASLGHEVVCGDTDVEKVRRLDKGEVSILEESLPELIADASAAGRLRFVDSAAAAAVDAEFVFLCVPTPQADDGGADLTIVDDVAREIARIVGPTTVIVNKSTMPVGSTRRVAQVLATAGAPDSVAVAANPEFLREGRAVHDFFHATRIVIGADSPAVAERVRALYDGVDAPFVMTDAASAELIKYAANAFLAAKISFVNGVANLCEVAGADIEDVVRGMGYDARIGFEFMRPGPGWGGACFTKDTSALVKSASDAGYDFSMLRGVIAANDEQHDRVVEKIREACGGSLRGVRVAVWGLTFKANTADIRGSSAIRIAREVVRAGGSVRAFDPAAGDEVTVAAPDLEIASDAYEACTGAEVLAILTEWDEFRGLDLDRVGGELATRRIVDARNLLDPSAVRRLGFEYTGIGR